MNPFSARYLDAKKAADDRALNGRVWTALADALALADASARPTRILEVGAGVGAGIERLVERGAVRQAVITALDMEVELLDEARRRLPVWAAEHGITARERDGSLILQRDDLKVEVAFEVTDLRDFARRPDNRERWDLLVANAVLDLLDLDTALPALLRLLRPGGLFYATIVFDGVTTLTPAIDPALDDLIERLYHASMDGATASSRTGRRLLPALRAAGAVPLAAGASDWVIFAGPDGYLAQDTTFLDCMLAFMERSLTGHPDLDPARFATWLARRREQLERRELALITHQLDVLARRGG